MISVNCIDAQTHMLQPRYPDDNKRYRQSSVSVQTDELHDYQSSVTELNLADDMLCLGKDSKLTLNDNNEPYVDSSIHVNGNAMERVDMYQNNSLSNTSEKCPNQEHNGLNMNYSETSSKLRFDKQRVAGNDTNENSLQQYRSENQLQGE